MKEYVVVHTRRIDEDGAYDDVLLVHKNKPDWQKGKLNLVGGKVEEGEDAIACALRELKEEAGLEPWDFQKNLYCGHIQGTDCIVHCVRLDVDPVGSRWLLPREEETEKVEWFTFKEAWADSRLMPNLRIIVPLMHLGVTGWTLIDKSSSSTLHEVEVILPLSQPNEKSTCEN